jgi:tripartite-type tricarboxylate transporter receptor subunit TctC
MIHVLRLALIAIGAALMAGAAPGDASAQSYPDKPLRLIVPFAPGGSPDIIGRMVAEDLAAALGQSVVVENRAGAGGNIAVQYVIDQPADGYTLLLGTSGNMASNKVLYRNLKFDPEVDLIPISVAYTTCNVLILSAAGPIKTVTA